MFGIGWRGGAERTETLGLAGYGDLALASAPGFDAVREDWRSLARRAALGPFQAPEWAEAQWSAGYGVGRGRLALVVGRRVGAGSAAGRVDLVLPLVVHGRGPVSVARILSNPHAGHRAPAVDADLVAALDRPGRLALEAALRRLTGAGLLLLERQPDRLCGRPNPWAGAGAVAHADAVCDSVMTQPFEAYDAAHRSAKSRSEERRREAKLARDHTVATEVPVTRAARLALLDEVVACKAAWLRQRGLAGLTSAAERDFLRRVAGLDEGGAARPHLVALRIDGELAAASLGVVAGDTYAGMLLAVGTGPWSRATPGQLLLSRIFRLGEAEGIRRFSFGVGENELKARWTDERTPLFSRAVASGPLAGAMAAAISTWWTARDGIKRRPVVHEGLLKARAAWTSLGTRHGAPSAG